MSSGYVWCLLVSLIATAVLWLVKNQEKAEMRYSKNATVRSSTYCKHSLFTNFLWAVPLPLRVSFFGKHDVNLQSVPGWDWADANHKKDQLQLQVD